MNSTNLSYSHPARSAISRAFWLCRSCFHKLSMTRKVASSVVGLTITMLRSNASWNSVGSACNAAENAASIGTKSNTKSRLCKPSRRL
ncbi:hypothetical protein D3C79_940940 [compost metagenome]